MAPIVSLINAGLAFQSLVPSLRSSSQPRSTQSRASNILSSSTFKAEHRSALPSENVPFTLVSSGSIHTSLALDTLSAARPTITPSLEQRQTSGDCRAGFVQCTDPSDAVCAGKVKFSKCAPSNCAQGQNLAQGVDCGIFNPESDYGSYHVTIPSLTIPPQPTQTTAPVKAQDSSAAPSSTATPTSAVDYNLFTGNGTAWPEKSDWVGSFGDMWSANLADVIGTTCDSFGANTDDESAAIKGAILFAAGLSGLDARFILAIVMQESRGCVRVNPTLGVHNNPGLMQDYDGPNSCNVNGAMQTPCPPSEIQGMINDGVFGDMAPGQAKGAGLMQDYKSATSQDPVSPAAQYYIAARLYNSGSYVNGDLGCGVATHCYSSDVANRLAGWTGVQSPCTDSKVMANCPPSSSSSSS